MKRIGVIGIGTMGHFMAEKLLERGYETHVFDVMAKAVADAVEKGAIAELTPASMAESCDLIVLSLPGPKQIEDVIFGTDGAAGKVRPGMIIVDTSTVDPASTRSVAARLAEKGVDYLDCPVLGRPSAIGKWMLPTGGNPEAVERARPILESFAATILPVGESGAGNAVKLLNQMMFTVINAVSSEVMAIADHCGISREVFYSAVANSSAATVSGLFKEVGRVIVNESFDEPTFTVDLLIKDTKLALQMAKESGAPSVIAGTVQMYNEIASAKGLGRQDSSAVYKVFQEHFKELEPGQGKD